MLPTAKKVTKPKAPKLVTNDAEREPLDSKAPNGWTGMHKATYRLTKPVYHHYAEKVLHFDPKIAEGIEKAVADMVEAACYHRGRKGASRGIDPDHLNKHLRDKLHGINPEWTFETTIVDGVLHDHGNHIRAAKGGFDISRYDVRENLVRLRNLCFGRRPLTKGREYWDAQLAKRPHWAQVAATMDWTEFPAGEDHSVAATRPTILGELQFGNWGLAYRDYLKVVAADNDLDIDCFLYIVPAGNLKRYLSSGIVTFDNAPKYLRKVAKAVRVPIVIWGLDVDIGERTGDLSDDFIQLMKTRVGRKSDDEDEEPLDDEDETIGLDAYTET